LQVNQRAFAGHVEQPVVQHAAQELPIGPGPTGRAIPSSFNLASALIPAPYPQVIPQQGAEKVLSASAA
jgi:hypothetical protein